MTRPAVRVVRGGPSPQTGVTWAAGAATCQGRTRNVVLAWADGARVAGQDGVELAAGADAELGEDLAQVVLDRARADEQPGADLRVGQPLPGQPRDLGLLGGQRMTGLAGWRADGLRGALADGLAGGQQLAAGALGEPPGSHSLEHLAGGAQLLARVHPAVVPAQPLPVEQVAAGQFGADAGAGEAVDGLTVEPPRGLALADQGGQAGPDPPPPLVGAPPRRLGHPPPPPPPHPPPPRPHPP